MAAGKLDSALSLAREGFWVFPLCPDSKVPIKGLRFKDMATRDEAQIRAWWAETPDANIGIYTGKWGDGTEALLVLDVDTKAGKNGFATLEPFEKEPFGFPDTREHFNPDGRGAYFLPCAARRQAAGLWPRRGYKITGRLRRGAGQHDQWPSLCGGPMTPAVNTAPQWLIDHIGEAPQREPAPANDLGADDPAAVGRAVRFLSDAPPAVEGQGGDAATYKTACRLKDFGISQATALFLLLEHWNERCSPPWPPSELGNKVHHAYRYGFESPGLADPTKAFAPVAPEAPAATIGASPPPPVNFGLTTGSDIDCAHYVIAEVRRKHPDALFSEGSFWWFDGEKFAAVPHNDLRRVLHNLDGAQLNTGRLKLGKTKIDSILHEAGVMAEAPGFFDNPPDGIPCKDGFISFDRNGRASIAPHSPKHRNRHVLAGSWSPGAAWQRSGSLFELLINGCFTADADKEAKVLLLGEVAGAAASGCVTRLVKPKAVVLHGVTAENGKSQWLDGLRGLLLGSAVSALPPEKFSDEKYAVQLVGKLLNAADELSSAKAISGDSFKGIITGEPRMARDVYGRAITFRPKALHLFATNVLPSFHGGMDKGVLRRLVVLQFDRTIPESERVEHIGARVAAEEADLLLAFAVEGASRLIARRYFAEPESSRTALRNWVCGADPVVAWFADRVDFEQGERLVKATAYQDFKNWARAEGFSERRLPAINNFVSRVTAQDNQIGEGRNREIGRYFINIKLAAETRLAFSAAQVDPFSDVGAGK